jgi:hypothetical protein
VSKASATDWRIVLVGWWKAAFDETIGQAIDSEMQMRLGCKEQVSVVTLH